MKNDDGNHFLSLTLAFPDWYAPLHLAKTMEERNEAIVRLLVARGGKDMTGYTESSMMLSEQCVIC